MPNPDGVMIPLDPQPLGVGGNSGPLPFKQLQVDAGDVATRSSDFVKEGKGILSAPYCPEAFEVRSEGKGIS